MSIRETSKIRGVLCVVIGALSPTLALAQAGPLNNCTMSIQAAINDAIVNGYTDVYIRPGVHQESVTITGGDVRLIAAADAACTAPAAPGTRPVQWLPNPGGGRVIEVRDHDVHLIRLDVAKGADSFGGNIATFSNGDLVLRDTWVYSGKADHGGGIALKSCGSIIIDGASQVYDNKATWGGGVAVYSSNCNPSNLWVDGSIHSNTSGDQGGNVRLDAATMQHSGLLARGVAKVEGGCLAAYNGSVVDIATGTIEGCETSVDRGGAVLLADSDLYGYEAGIASGYSPTAGGLVSVQNGTVVFERSKLYYGKTDGAGGGIAAEHSSVDLIDTYLGESHATKVGGGIYAAAGPVGLDGETSIRLCDASEGGGVYARSGTVITISGLWSPKDEPDLPVGGVRIDENKAKYGGGVRLVDSSIVGSGLVLSRNYADADGGGIDAYGGTANLSRTVVQENKAGSEGGGVHALSGSLLEFRSGSCDPVAEGFPKNRYCTEFRYNFAKRGGGAYSDFSDLGFDRVAFVDNDDDADEGSAIELWEYSELVMRNVLVEDGLGTKSTVGVWKDGNVVEMEHVTYGEKTSVRIEANTTGFIEHSVFGLGADGLTGGAVGAGVVGQCNVGKDVTLLGGPNNDPSDPLFTSTSRGRYRLDPASPAIDQCWGFLPIDLDANLRPAGNGDDSGAFEM